LWDKFFLEGDARTSLRDIITREMLVNTLMHREFTSSYIAKFIIENDKMFVENANRALNYGEITPDNYEPNPKNPLIASFFRNIGLADELGSGVRKLYHYGLRYSGEEPKLIEGDVFRIIVPLNNNYSFETGIEFDVKDTVKDTVKITAIQEIIIQEMLNNDAVTISELSEKTGINMRNVKNNIAKLKENGLVERIGADKNGHWKVKIPRITSQANR
jgi:ATP-dependent DNA helicase RecG